MSPLKQSLPSLRRPDGRQSFLVASDHLDGLRILQRAGLLLLRAPVAPESVPCSCRSSLTLRCSIARVRREGPLPRACSTMRLAASTRAPAHSEGFSQHCYFIRATRWNFSLTLQVSVSAAAVFAPSDKSAMHSRPWVTDHCSEYPGVMQTRQHPIAQLAHGLIIGHVGAFWS